MNYRQEHFDQSNSFHVSHVAEDYEVSNIKPVIHTSADVKKMSEESARAKIISQIVGATDEYPARDFAASFQDSIKNTLPPQFMTSHKTCPNSRRRPTVPTYPSMVQSLRWNPYVEMSSVENSHTELVEENPKFNCRCESCTVKNCPSKVFSSGTMKPVVFKDNIMKFSDRYTMTPRLNDACCGVCTAIPTNPKVSDVSVPSDIAEKDTETVTNFSPMYTHQGCTPILILKRTESGHPVCTHGYCGHATGHVPFDFHQEAVRDTDVVDNYCEPIKPKSLKNFLKFKKKHVIEHPHCMPEYRKIIYNEGINDKGANNCPKPPIRVPSPINVRREHSGVSVKTKNRCYVEPEESIPYAHRTQSRYHNSCKNSNFRPSYNRSDVHELRHAVESPKIVRKMITTRIPVRPCWAASISLPRKVLTSEADIESYIDKRRQESNTELKKNWSGRRKKSKK